DRRRRRPRRPRRRLATRARQGDADAPRLLRRRLLRPDPQPWRHAYGLHRRDEGAGRALTSRDAGSPPRRFVVHGPAPTGPQMITVENVTKAYAGKKLFENVNVSFPPGRRYGLTGPNGA